MAPLEAWAYGDMTLVAKSNAHSSNPAADAAMDRYADGDDAAFGELYDALAPRLNAFLSRKLRDPTRVADLLQETMLRMHCARGRFVRGSCVTPWAFTIAQRLVFDGARRKRIEHLSVNGDPDGEHLSEEPTPDEVLGAHQTDQVIKREVLRLPVGQRLAFELVQYGDLSYAEAAETLGVTIASVKLRVHRANATIRRACGVSNEVQS